MSIVSIVLLCVASLAVVGEIGSLIRREETHIFGSLLWLATAICFVIATH